VLARPDRLGGDLVATRDTLPVSVWSA
jgi:hypothetical protein